MNKVGALFVISLIVLNTSPNSLAQLDVTSSATLEELAQNLQNNIKAATTDPCDNYFDFVCESAVANRNLIKLNIEDIFNGLYDGAHLNNFEGDTQIKNFFKSCKKADLSQLPASIIKFSRSGNYWPAFNPNWTESKFDINIAVSEINSFGLDAFIELDFERRGAAEVIFKLSPDDVSVYRNAEYILNYTTLPLDQIAEIVDDCNNLKDEYRKAIKSIGEDTVLETDISSLDTILPQINWKRMSSLYLGTANVTSYRVIVQDVNKLKAIVSLMFNVNPRWIANYLFYLYVRKGVSVLEITNPGQHEKYCRDAPIKYFTHSVFHKMIRNHKNLKKQKIVMDIIKLSANYFRNQYYAFQEYSTSDELNTALDSELTNFLEEIEQASSKIEYDLDMSPDDFFHNRLLLKRFSNYNYRKYIEDSNDYYIATQPDVYENFPRGPLATLMFTNYSEFTPIIFNFVAKTFISTVISESRKTKNMLSMPTLRDCLKTQMNNRLNDDAMVENLLKTEVLFNIFKEFSLKYPDIAKSEEVIFEKQGLTSKKAMFMIFMQQYCDIPKYKGKTSEAIYKQKRALTQLANYEDFGLEYDCPVGSPMNPVVKCSH